MKTKLCVANNVLISQINKLEDLMCAKALELRNSKTID